MKTFIESVMRILRSRSCAPAPHKARALAAGLMSVVVAGLLVAGVAPDAMAQAAPESIGQIVGATPASDKSTSIMNQALGGDFFVSPFSAIGAPTTILGGMLLVFNGAIFLVAVFWGSYNILRGIVSTAHEGAVLGQRLSAVWLPVRMVTGIAGVVPVFGGFNLGQAVLASCAAIGIGIANMMWNGAINMSTTFTAALNPGITVPSTGKSFKDAAQNLFQIHVCARAVGEQEAVAAAQNAASAEALGFITPPDGDGQLLGGVKFGTPSKPSLCGQVAIYRLEGQPGRQPNALGFRVAAVNYRNIARSVQDGYRDAFPAFNASVKSIADDWYAARAAYQAGSGSAIAAVPLAALDAAASQFAINAQAAAANGASGVNADLGAIMPAVAEQMRSDGWAGAGAWYATFAEINSAITDAVQSIRIESIPPNITSDTGATVVDAVNAIQKSTEAAKGLSTKPTGGDSGFSLVKAALGDTLGMEANTVTGEWSIGQSIVEKMIGVASFDSAGKGTINPIIMFKNMGDYMMVLGEGMLVVGKGFEYLASPVKAVASTAADFANGVMGGSPSEPGKLGKLGLGLAGDIMAILPTIAWFLIGVGLLLSVYIPLIPFITWMGGLIQYVVIVFEGLVAMTLAALSHMEAEGDGMGQRTEAGYIFLLNVIARPACMLLGFFAATALLTTLGTYLIYLYMGAVANAQGNSVTGMFTIIGMLLVFFFISWTLIQGMFNMIFLVPDNVIGMIGRGSSSDIGRDVERGVQGIVLGVARTVKSGGPSMQAALTKGKNDKGDGDPDKGAVAKKK